MIMHLMVVLGLAALVGLGMLINRLRTHGWRVLLAGLASFLAQRALLSRLAEPLYMAAELDEPGRDEDGAHDLQRSRRRY